MPGLGVLGTRSAHLVLVFVTTLVVLALVMGARLAAKSNTNPSTAASTPRVSTVLAAGADTVPPPQPPATATLVPRDATVVLQVDTSHPSSQAAVPTTPEAIRLAVGAGLVVDAGTAYELTDIQYDPFFLTPAGQSADGSPQFTAADYGASYLRAVAMPRCSLDATPCELASVPVYYLIETGDLRGQKEVALVQAAQVRATALAQPTHSPAQIQTQVAAQDTQVAAIPSATPCPFPICPVDGVTVTPLGAGFLISGAGVLGRAPIENIWMERLADGTSITVSAGAVALHGGVNVPISSLQPASQGAVFVQLSTRPAYQIEIYRTPDQHGSLHIVSVQGEQLTMLAKDGTTFVFDVPSRSFLSSTGQPIATSTDTPTALPSETPPVLSYPDMRATFAPGVGTTDGSTPMPTSLSTPAP